MMPTGLYFQMGAARYFYSLGDLAQRSLANETIENVRKMSPNYLPLLEFDAETQP